MSGDTKRLALTYCANDDGVVTRTICVDKREDTASAHIAAAAGKLRKAIISVCSRDRRWSGCGGRSLLTICRMSRPSKTLAYSYCCIHYDAES